MATWLHLVRSRVNDERPGLRNSPLAGFTHSLIGVYVTPVQSALGGTPAPLRVRLAGMNPCKVKPISAEACTLGLISCVRVAAVYLRCHALPFCLSKLPLRSGSPAVFGPPCARSTISVATFSPAFRLLTRAETALLYRRWWPGSRRSE